MTKAPTPPPCRRLGTQCRRLRVTLLVSADLAALRDGDHEATWLLGHTEGISFGPLWRHREDLFCRATLHVPCKHLEESGGKAHCRAHGSRGDLPSEDQPRQRRQLGGQRFRVVERGRLGERDLPMPTPRRRTLTVLSHNPCADVGCPGPSKAVTTGAPLLRDSI